MAPDNQEKNKAEPGFRNQPEDQVKAPDNAGKSAQEKARALLRKEYRAYLPPAQDSAKTEIPPAPESASSIKIRPVIIRTPEEIKMEKEERRVSLKGEMIQELEKMTPFLIKGTEGDGKILAKDKEQFNVSYKKAQGLFKTLTGEDLNRKIKEEIVRDAKSEGRILMSEEEYFGKENVSKLEEKEKKRRVLAGISAGWARLSEKQKEDFHNEPKEFVKKLEDKRKELEKKGLFVPKESYYDLLLSYDMHIIGERGILNKKIIIPSALGIAQTITRKEFQKWMQDYQNYFTAGVSQLVKDRLNRGLLEARSRVLERKAKKMTELFGRVDSEPASATEQTLVVGIERSKSKTEQGKTQIDWVVEKEKILKEAAKKNEALLGIARETGEGLKLIGGELSAFIDSIYSDTIIKLPPKTKNVIDMLTIRRINLKGETDESLLALKKRKREYDKLEEERILREIATKFSKRGL